MGRLHYRSGFYSTMYIHMRHRGMWTNEGSSDERRRRLLNISLQSFYRELRVDRAHRFLLIGPGPDHRRQRRAPAAVLANKQILYSTEPFQKASLHTRAALYNREDNPIPAKYSRRRARVDHPHTQSGLKQPPRSYPPADVFVLSDCEDRCEQVLR